MNTTNNIETMTTFILDLNNTIFDARGQQRAAQNVTTSICWSLAAAYNNQVRFIENLNKRLAEFEENGIEELSQDENISNDIADPIRETRDALIEAEKELSELGCAFAWAHNFTKNELNEPNTLHPNPENIIPKFSEASADPESYRPTQEQIDKLMKIKKISPQAMAIAIDTKANKEMTRALEGAKWSLKNQKQIISELDTYVKKQIGFSMSDRLALRLWNKLADKMADYYQRSINDMLDVRNARVATAGMQNIDHFEHFQNEANKFVNKLESIVNA